VVPWAPVYTPTQNGVSIGSAVFAGMAVLTNRHANLLCRHTDHATSVTIGRDLVLYVRYGIE